MENELILEPEESEWFIGMLENGVWQTFQSADIWNSGFYNVQGPFEAQEEAQNCLSLYL